MGHSAYSASEYDAFVVGEWRQVTSYCPRRHCYVVELAAPIVAATVDQADPEAMMEYEPWKDEFVSVRQIIIDYMAGRAMTAREVAEGAGINRPTVNGHLSDPRAFEPAGEKLIEGRTCAARTTARLYRALPNPYIPGPPGGAGLQERNRGKIETLARHIREHGDMTLGDAANVIDMHPSTLLKSLDRTTLVTSYRAGRNRYLTVGEE